MVVVDGAAGLGDREEDDVDEGDFFLVVRSMGCSPSSPVAVGPELLARGIMEIIMPVRRAASSGFLRLKSRGPSGCGEAWGRLLEVAGNTGVE